MNIYKVKLIHFRDETDRSVLKKVALQACLAAVRCHQLKVYWDSVVWLQFVIIG